MIAETATRETFANLPVWAIAFWYFLIFLSTGILFYGIYRLARKYRQGRGPAELDQPVRRIRSTARIVLSHSWIRRRDPLSGLGHLFVFYGFLVLFIGTAILAFQDDVAGPLGFDFFTGWFYKALLALPRRLRRRPVVGLIVLAVKRGIVKPFRLSYWRPDREPGEPGWDRSRYVARRLAVPRPALLPGAVRLPARGVPDRRDRPVRSRRGRRSAGSSARAFIDIGFDGGSAQMAHRVDWWIHGVVALAFVASIPFTKAVHMIAGPAGVAAKDDKTGARLPAAPGERQVRRGRLPADHRPASPAPARSGRLHEVRQVPCGVPRDGVGLPALAA